MKQDMMWRSYNRRELAVSVHNPTELSEIWRGQVVAGSVQRDKQNTSETKGKRHASFSLVKLFLISVQRMVQAELFKHLGLFESLGCN